MILKIQKLSLTAIMPTRANTGDAGLDLYADIINVQSNGISTPLNKLTDDEFNLPIDFIEYGTSIAVEIPEGYVGLLFSRSSITSKDLMLKNCVGVIDSGYRGEIKMRFQPTNILWNDNIYKIGDKIGQLVLVPFISLETELVNKLGESQRGESGFGSSGA